MVDSIQQKVETLLAERNHILLELDNLKSRVSSIFYDGREKNKENLKDSLCMCFFSRTDERLTPFYHYISYSFIESSADRDMKLYGLIRSLQDQLDHEQIKCVVWSCLFEAFRVSLSGMLIFFFPPILLLVLLVAEKLFLLAVNNDRLSLYRVGLLNEQLRESESLIRVQNENLRHLRMDVERFQSSQFSWEDFLKKVCLL